MPTIPVAVFPNPVKSVANVTTANTTAQAQTRSIAIDSRQILPQALPQLALGDVVKLTVRQNFGNGQGQIYFKGQLIDASLPQNLVSGDKLLAKILFDNDQLLFQILDHQKAENSKNPATLKSLEAKLASLFQELPAPSLRNGQSLSLPTSLQNLGLDQGVLQNLFAQIGSGEQLQNSQTLAAQLQATKDSALPELFRQVSQTIYSFLEQHADSGSQNFLAALRTELSTLLEKGVANNEVALRQLGNLITMLQDEIGMVAGKSRPEHKQLELLLNQLKTALQNPEQQAEIIESTLKQLIDNQNLTKQDQSQLNPQASRELLQLANRLEQLATTFETLNQLNPLMQAMGEPALILFPFLFHGLISHSEVSVQTKHSKKKRGEKDSGEEGEGSDSGNDNKHESFQRIQVTVPLPHFGAVDVDIAHRTEEILVRFAVDDNDKLEFLVEQLEQLGVVLREKGFTKTELMATVGKKKENIALWTIGLSSMGSRAA